MKPALQNEARFWPIQRQVIGEDNVETIYVDMNEPCPFGALTVGDAAIVLENKRIGTLEGFLDCPADIDFCNDEVEKLFYGED